MSRLRPYAELVRLPNVFTAFADIALGWVAARSTGSIEGTDLHFALLLAASGCLYTGGMVLNDFFDVEQDRRERPFRPIPSGRVRRSTAGWLGALLVAQGMGFAFAAGWGMGERWNPAGVLAALLAGTILLYDGVLKRTWAGPLAMGSCRFLNVLLGLSVAGEAGLGWGFRLHLALVVGVYIVGVTWFARTEARTSSQSSLAAAAGVMLTALLVALALPEWFPAGSTSVFFPYLLVVFGFLVGFPAARAVARPAPKHVQAAVKRAVLGLVVLDAVLATALAGVTGLLLLLLLLPALYLGRWIYST